MTRHRTRARVAVILLFLGVIVGTAGARPAPEAILFPVVGSATFQDDFGDARAQGGHEANDILAERAAPVVAVEAGRIEFWNTSARAGCMLYLYGRSGTTYLYVHLNNDLTAGNDNKGRCEPGVSYAPGLSDGQKVRAGQLIGFVGDSGDANGLHPHLHFELHPGDGAAVSPFRWLQAAQRLLFALPPLEGGQALTLALHGQMLSSKPGSLTMRVARVRMSNGWRFEVGQEVTIAVPDAAVIERAQGSERVPASVGSAAQGERVVVWTAPVADTLDAQLGKRGALAAAQVLFRGPG